MRKLLPVNSGIKQLSMLTKTIRWILVLPGGILAGIAATFILHFLLYLILSKFFSTYPEFPERALTPFSVAIAFVMIGTAIAPYYKTATALTLLFIWLTFAILLAVIHFSDGHWFGKETYLEADGLAMASGIIGAFLALLLVKQRIRKTKTNESNSEDYDLKNKSLRIQRNQDIADFVFLSLFILCIFNDVSRKVFFGFYFAFLLFITWFSVREKFYKTNIELFNVVKGIFMAACLLVGLIYPTIGIYVSIICSFLCALPFIMRTIREVRYPTIKTASA